MERNILSSVECEEVSTYKVGSRGRLGAQAIVKQRLTYRSEQSPRNQLYGIFCFYNSLIFWRILIFYFSAGPWEAKSVQFEYDDSRVNEPESANFNADEFVQEICQKGVQQGLTNEHSDNFKDLVLAIRGYTVSDLKSLFERSKAKCTLAG